MTAEEKLVKKQQKIVKELKSIEGLSPEFYNDPVEYLRQELEAKTAKEVYIKMKENGLRLSEAQFKQGLKCLNLPLNKAKIRNFEAKQKIYKQAEEKGLTIYLTDGQRLLLQLLFDGRMSYKEAAKKITEMTGKNTSLQTVLQKVRYSLKRLEKYLVTPPKKREKKPKVTTEERMAIKKQWIIEELKLIEGLEAEFYTDPVEYLRQELETKTPQWVYIQLKENGLDALEKQFTRWLKYLNLPLNKIVIRDFEVKQKIYEQAKEKGLIEFLRQDQILILEPLFDKGLNQTKIIEEFEKSTGKKILPRDVSSKAKRALTRLEKYLVTPPKKREKKPKVTTEERMAIKKQKRLEELKLVKEVGDNPVNYLGGKLTMMTASELYEDLREKGLKLLYSTFKKCLENLGLPMDRIWIRNYISKKDIYDQAKKKDLIKFLKQDQMLILELLFDKKLNLTETIEKFEEITEKRILPQVVPLKIKGALSKLEKYLIAPPKDPNKINLGIFKSWQRHQRKAQTLETIGFPEAVLDVFQAANWTPNKIIYVDDEVLYKLFSRQQEKVVLVRKLLLNKNIICPNSKIFSEIDLLNLSKKCRKILLSANKKTIETLDSLATEKIGSDNVSEIKKELNRLKRELDAWKTEKTA